MRSAKGVRLIGDLPFFVSPDSSDVWANPELFLLDEQQRPRFVAGVPPDYFSSEGQLWGNPVYDWEALRRTGYRWCIDRIRSLARPRGRDPPGSFSRVRGRLACTGRSTHGPIRPVGPGSGRRFLQRGEEGVGRAAVHRGGSRLDHAGRCCPPRPVPRARDTGPAVCLRRHSDNPYLPHNYVPNTVVYTGTHDNPTTRGWYEELPDVPAAELVALS